MFYWETFVMRTLSLLAVAGFIVALGVSSVAYAAGDCSGMKSTTTAGTYDQSIADGTIKKTPKPDQGG